MQNGDVNGIECSSEMEDSNVTNGTDNDISSEQDSSVIIVDDD